MPDAYRAGFTEGGGGGFVPGAATRIPFGNSGGTGLTDSSNLTYDDTTKTLAVSGAAANLTADATAGTTASQILVKRGGSTVFDIGSDSGGNLFFRGASGKVVDFIAQGTGTVGFWTSNTERLRIASDGVMTASSRLEEKKGADVASAGTLTLGADGNVFNVTGTTTINFITTASWQAGSRITLILKGAITVNHNTGAPPGGTAAIKLAGAANLTGADGDVVTLFYDGTVWRGGRVAATGA